MNPALQVPLDKGTPHGVELGGSSQGRTFGWLAALVLEPKCFIVLIPPARGELQGAAALSSALTPHPSRNRAPQIREPGQGVAPWSRACILASTAVSGFREPVWPRSADSQSGRLPRSAPSLAHEGPALQSPPQWSLCSIQ